MDPKDIYKVIDDFSMPDWRRFVKTHLRLTLADIEQVEHHDPKDLREQKYNMVTLWQNRNGYAAGIRELGRLVIVFRNPTDLVSQPFPEGRATRINEGPYGQNHTPNNLLHSPSEIGRHQPITLSRQPPDGGQLTAHSMPSPTNNDVPDTQYPETGGQKPPLYGKQPYNGGKFAEPSSVQNCKLRTSVNIHQPVMQTLDEEWETTSPKNEKLQSHSTKIQPSLEKFVSKEAQSLVKEAPSQIMKLKRPSPEGRIDARDQLQGQSQLNDSKQSEKETNPKINHPVSKNLLVSPQLQKNERTFSDDNQDMLTKSQDVWGKQELYDKLCQQVGILAVDECSKQTIQRIKNDPGNYEMNHHLKGYVLIFNNSFEGQEDERKGSKTDVKNLKNLWEKFGCKIVNGLEELDGEEMITRFKQFVQSKKRRPCDFVCFFIMSHGNNDGGEEYFLGSDHHPVKMSEILPMLDNNYDGTTLRGIPKLLFLQFCRGEQLDSPVEPAWLDKIFPSILKFSKPQPDVSSDSVDTVDVDLSLPTRSDILVSYATQSGCKAIRDTVGGSWFINATVNTFSKFAAKEHVLDMMTRVNHAVSLKSGKLNTGEKCKEMSECRTLLRKKLYLLPGDVVNEDEF